MSLPAIDENWDRWIFASVFKYIKTGLPSDYHVYIEGTERSTNEHPVYLEVRIDGPFYRPHASYYRLEIELNIEISVQLGRQLYTQNVISGKVATLMENSIPVYKYGNLAGDNANDSIGCLTIDDSAGVIVHRYGQIAPKTRLLQGTVEAKYIINLPG